MTKRQKLYKDAYATQEEADDIADYLTKSEHKQNVYVFKDKIGDYNIAYNDPTQKDTDQDGVPDYRDCEPKNPKKHGIGTTFALGAGASFVGSEVSRYVAKRRRLDKLNQSNEEKKYWKWITCG